MNLITMQCERVDYEMQFDWIEGRFVSCWLLMNS